MSKREAEKDWENAWIVLDIFCFWVGILLVVFEFFLGSVNEIELLIVIPVVGIWFCLILVRKMGGIFWFRFGS